MRNTGQDNVCVFVCVRVWVRVREEEKVSLCLIKSTQTYYRLRGKWNSYLLTLLACYKWHLCSDVSSEIEWKALFQGTSCTEHNYNLLCHHVWPFSVSPGSLGVPVNNESDTGGRNQSMESHLISKWIFLTSQGMWRRYELRPRALHHRLESIAERYCSHSFKSHNSH